jgi:Protein of unknown function (DUF541)
MQATTVAAQGTAETKFNLATFHISLSETGDTVPAAKALLSRSVDALNEAVESLKQTLSVEFVKNSVCTSSSTQEKWEYNRKTQERENKGFQMAYSMSFDVDNLDQVSGIYDALTSIPKINVQQPIFALKSKNHEKLNTKALQLAQKRIVDRFAMECETLGLNSADFEIVNWEATYSDSNRSDRVSKGARTFAVAAALGGSSAELIGAPLEGASNSGPVIGFAVGLASVTVNLEVGYARKA